MTASIRQHFLSIKVLMPVGVLLWLIVCLAFALLIPPADALSAAAHGCPSNKTEAQDGVWSPSRHRIISLCQFASARLNFEEVWPGDEDDNLYVTVDQLNLQSNRKGIQNIQSWCEAQDTRLASEGGSMDPLDPCRTGKGSGSPPQPSHLASNMNWEIIPRDACTIPSPSWPQDISVYGVHVRDKWHGYNEIHPVTELTNASGQTYVRGSSCER